MYLKLFIAAKNPCSRFHVQVWGIAHHSYVVGKISCHPTGMDRLSHPFPTAPALQCWTLRAQCLVYTCKFTCTLQYVKYSGRERKNSSFSHHHLIQWTTAYYAAQCHDPFTATMHRHPTFMHGPFQDPWIECTATDHMIFTHYLYTSFHGNLFPLAWILY